ncbi:hypothetical protein ACI2KR_06450 [Pseudomonas luteola]
MMGQCVVSEACQKDVELLDRAAKAQGWIDFPSDSSERGTYWHFDSSKAPFGPRIYKSSWNPLEHDGDALRLAVYFGIFQNPTLIDRFQIIYKDEFEKSDDQAVATRRAIVILAVEIDNHAKGVSN